jgi:eukaryotic-like serine/threonine-protein kinase
VTDAPAVVGGKYRLIRRIGAGGMGEVWVAVNRTTGAEVAVKMVREAHGRDDALARFRHEARLGAMLAHRGIVRIYDLVEENDGPLLLVMELLRGETLERHLQRRGPLPAREALGIAVPLLSALAHAHACGIVHRDVTPANVFLAVDPDDYVTPKLVDFGIAKVPAGPTHTLDGRALGTPRYMAPERIREDGALDGRSDLFSVGVLLYEMLTGSSPFAASSPAASLAAVLETTVDPDPRIDPRLWLELRRALAKRPYERPPTAEAMAEGLMAAAGETEAQLGEALRQAPVARDEGLAQGLAGAPTQTVDGQSYGPTAATPARSWARVGAWAGGVAAVGAALALWGARRAPPPPPIAAALVATTTPAPGPPPAAVVPGAAPSATTAPPVASQAPPRTIRPRKPRPVATTPGF